MQADNQRDNLQFYPTPPELAKRAWAKFENTKFSRVLEPSAGNGDLASAHPWAEGHRRRLSNPLIDACEIDVSRHPTLRAKGISVIGVDFLALKDGALFSHIIMNPPFNEGARHVLKAWDLLWDGEIVAIVNAQTVRNAFSGERKQLAQLIERHGSVEFIEDAFNSQQAERPADVEVALIHLRKKASLDADFLSQVTAELSRDDKAEGLSEGYREEQAIALPNSLIENSVRVFDCAVKAMRESVLQEARARYFARVLGQTLAVHNGEAGINSAATDSSEAWVQGVIAERYAELKDRAWAGILRSTNVTSKLSSSAQKRVEADFENIKQLEFTVANIRGFLCGLVESAGQIQISMVCDVFDLITRYHSENTVFYKGWKSNDRHRTCGMRIKTTRFVLPGQPIDSWQKSISWESMQRLADFDKVFAMLDGKAAPEFGLAEAFRLKFDELRTGQRVQTSYFDVRFYPRAGTTHFFARDKALMDRLNRLVGAQRGWLPASQDAAGKGFWEQYAEAERLDKAVRTKLAQKARSHWDDPSRQIYRDGQEQAEAAETIASAVLEVLSESGISTEFALDYEPAQQPALLLAA